MKYYFYSSKNKISNIGYTILKIEHINDSILYCLHPLSMESLLTSYGLPFDEFRRLTVESNALVAGSAALALYLQQEGIAPGFEPSDLDIWVEETHDTWFSTGRVRELANTTTFTLFLVKHGYDLTTKFDSTINEHYYSTMTNIKHIFHFVNRHGKEVQLISVRDDNLIQYIQHHFDLTACISWWNAIENVFCTAYPGFTCRKEVHILQGFAKEERTLQRIEKYKARGFTICESLCPALRVIDSHENMEELDHANAFDVFAYEDVHAGTYLRQSSYHVLLHIGNQFHAYHRKQLCDYLHGHIREHSDYGKVCELPHKQQLLTSILHILPYSDYSIISLKHIIDNLYDAEYYTTTQWAAKTPAHPYEFMEPVVDSSSFRQTRVTQLSERARLLMESLLRDGILQ